MRAHLELQAVTLAGLYSAVGAAAAYAPLLEDLRAGRAVTFHRYQLPDSIAEHLPPGEPCELLELTPGDDIVPAT